MLLAERKLLHYSLHLAFNGILWVNFLRQLARAFSSRAYLEYLVVFVVQRFGVQQLLQNKHSRRSTGDGFILNQQDMRCHDMSALLPDPCGQCVQFVHICYAQKRLWDHAWLSFVCGSNSHSSCSKGNESKKRDWNNKKALRRRSSGYLELRNIDKVDTSGKRVQWVSGRSSCWTVNMSCLLYRCAVLKGDELCELKMMSSCVSVQMA